MTSQPCDSFGHHDSSGYPHPGESADSSAASAVQGGQATVPSGGSGGNHSSFTDALDTFHAEFITQPIDYPLDVSPPPPITLHNPNCPSGSPTTCHPNMSPGLPSFLDTYTHPGNLQEQGNNSFTLK